MAATTTGSAYRARRGRPELVDVPQGRFLTVAGVGEPGGERFRQAVAALYAVAYAAKLALRRKGVDVKLSPLEGLYPAAGGGAVRPRAT